MRGASSPNAERAGSREGDLAIALPAQSHDGRRPEAKRGASGDEQVPPRELLQRRHVRRNSDDTDDDEQTDGPTFKRPDVAHVGRLPQRRSVGPGSGYRPKMPSMIDGPSMPGGESSSMIRIPPTSSSGWRSKTRTASCTRRRRTTASFG